MKNTTSRAVQQQAVAHTKALHGDKRGPASTDRTQTMGKGGCDAPVSTMSADSDMPAASGSPSQNSYGK